MATLDTLKRELRQEATGMLSPTQSLSDTQYSAGLDYFVQGSGWKTYQEFIIPQISHLVTSLLQSRTHISVLEIGPGPKSVLGYLPSNLRRKIRRLTAFEPNDLFATRLEEWLCSTSQTESPLPCLEMPPNIQRQPYVLESNTGSSTGTNDSNGQFDIILFCHSMYGVKPKHKFIEQALKMLVERPEGGTVVVFHRDGTLRLDGLVCHQTASFPTGVIRVPNDDDTLDCFAPFITGFVMKDADEDTTIRAEWRKVCRALGRREEAFPDHLLFSSPEVMLAFTQNATALRELTAEVPLVKGDKTIKNREARLHRAASIMRPTDIEHIQNCVRWALKHRVGLTVIGGGHSSQCLWPSVVAVDMSAFDQVHILKDGDCRGRSGHDFGSLVVVEAGCKTGDIVSKSMAAGLVVPLGSRPSVGAGLWLQGGIGHLARVHGLACDSIVGAVVVSVVSSQVLCVGHVPSQHCPAGSIRLDNEADLLWALKGAGTNFGIVVSVTFKAFGARTFSVRNWAIPLTDDLDARRKLQSLGELTSGNLPRDCSVDLYLYWNTDQLYLGVTMFESSTTGATFETHTTHTPTLTLLRNDLGPEISSESVDSVGLFETEMYMSDMHGRGHGAAKTSSFKRCLFLKHIGAVNIVDILVASMKARPSSLCYLHLLHSGGAVTDVAAEATAFGCRDWDFACVITGVWPRDHDGTEAAQATVQWVYNVATDLLTISSGVYSADIGPDPRDAVLATKAFGPNRPRLALLKQILDPHNVLAYACPLPKAPTKLKLIILVTGDSCAGKDYSAQVWASMFSKFVTARVVSISDATKREYAIATDADLNSLLSDRIYKEQHRPALTAFFHDQVQKRPRLPEEHFLQVVHSAADVDVLLITGMRDEAPVAVLSQLVPENRLLDVRVKANEGTRFRRGYNGNSNSDAKDDNEDGKKCYNCKSNSATLDYRPSLIFDNDKTGDDSIKTFAERWLLPFLHKNLQRLANMVYPVPDFPRPGIEFRHVLNICQQPGGLNLCISLLQTHFSGDWTKVDAVACCEAGGFVYASALAARIDVPLVLIREAGKLPPPTISVIKCPSHVSCSASIDLKQKRIEIGEGVISTGASLMVVDDVLATGKTLCAVLELLIKAGINHEDISVMTVAEFPIHGGRELLRKRGFGKVDIQSLLVFGGA